MKNGEKNPEINHTGEFKNAFFRIGSSVYKLIQKRIFPIIFKIIRVKPV